MTDLPENGSRADEEPNTQRRFGEWLLVGGHLTPNQLEQVIARKRQTPDVPLGQVCVDLGFLSGEELEYLLTRFGRRLPIGEMLVHAGLITHAQLHAALMAQRREGGRVGEILVRLGVVTEPVLHGFLASQYNLPFISIREMTPDPELRRVVEKAHAARNRLVPVSLLGRRLTVAMSDPSLRGCAEDLQRTTGLDVIPILTSPSDLGMFFAALYGEPLEDVLLARWEEGEAVSVGDTARETQAAAEVPGATDAEEAVGATVEETTAAAEVDDAADREAAVGATVGEMNAATPATPRTGRPGPSATLDVDVALLPEEALDAAGEKDRVEVEDSPVVETLVQSMLSHALRIGARAVHLEADVAGPRLRYRVDGLLRESPLGGGQDELLRANYRSLLFHLKTLAHLDYTEDQRPQESGFRMVARRDGRSSTLDFRMATLPGRGGEGAVIRILDEARAPQSLERLGLSTDVQEAFRALIHRPGGIVLVTGPADSGKSATLHAALRAIQRPELKILTAEDPIGFALPGIVQTEVNASIDRTTACLLRAFLRLDADVIMVHELSDGAATELALRAAATGRLLLSALHVGNATDAVQRMLALNDDPNALASTLGGVMAQRLVRRNCPDCLESYQPDRDLLLRWFRTPPPGVRWMRGRSCASCAGTGYAGRIPVTELWIPSAREAALIHRRASSEEIRNEARQRMSTLAEDALAKAIEGLTTIEEASRVVPYADVEQIRATGMRRGTGVPGPRSADSGPDVSPPDLARAA